MAKAFKYYLQESLVKGVLAAAVAVLLITCKHSEDTDSTFIKNVIILTMNDGPSYIKGKGVLVKKGIINGIYAENELSDFNGRIIDGGGRYLIPGLIDAHLHVKDQADLTFYILNGLTAIRSMRGEPRLLRWRKAIEDGIMLGPRMVVAGPIIYNQNNPAFEYVGTPEEGREIVNKHKKSGYDLIKLYNVDSLTYEAIINEAAKLSIPVSGHWPNDKLTPERIVKSGMLSIEHFWFIYMNQFHGLTSDEMIKQIVDAFKGSDTFIVPNIEIVNRLNEFSLKKTKYPLEPYENNLGYFIWKKGAYEALTEIKDADSTDLFDMDTMKELLISLHKAGVLLAPGTDSSSHLGLPGFALHNEIEFYVECGLSPYDALVTSTVNASKLLGLNGGCIEKGKNADLILLDKSPLNDISNTRQPWGVMIDGKWIDNEKLTQLRKVFVKL